MHPPRALLFDFGGTLDGPDHWLDRLLKHYRAAELELCRKELDSAYDSATRQAYTDHAVRGFGFRELVEYLVELQFGHLLESGPASVRLALTDERSRRIRAASISGGFVAESLANLEGSRRVMQSLRRRFKLGVVSNFYGNLGRVLDEAGFRELNLDAVVDSVREGVFKPEPLIYQ